MEGGGPTSASISQHVHEYVPIEARLFFDEMDGLGRTLKASINPYQIPAYGPSNPGRHAWEGLERTLPSRVQGIRFHFRGDGHGGALELLPNPESVRDLIRYCSSTFRILECEDASQGQLDIFLQEVVAQDPPEPDPLQRPPIHPDLVRLAKRIIGGGDAHPPPPSTEDIEMLMDGYEDAVREKKERKKKGCVQRLRIDGTLLSQSHVEQISRLVPRLKLLDVDFPGRYWRNDPFSPNRTSATTAPALDYTPLRDALSSSPTLLRSLRLSGHIPSEVIPNPLPSSLETLLMQAIGYIDWGILEILRGCELSSLTALTLREDKRIMDEDTEDIKNDAVYDRLLWRLPPERVRRIRKLKFGISAARAKEAMIWMKWILSMPNSLETVGTYCTLYPHTVVDVLRSPHCNVSSLHLMTLGFPEDMAPEHCVTSLLALFREIRSGSRIRKFRISRRIVRFPSPTQLGQGGPTIDGVMTEQFTQALTSRGFQVVQTLLSTRYALRVGLVAANSAAELPPAYIFRGELVLPPIPLLPPRPYATVSDVPWEDHIHTIARVLGWKLEALRV